MRTCGVRLQGLDAYGDLLRSKQKELLEIVLGVERFEGYVYGRKIFIDTDHKSPEVYYECSKAIAENRLRVQKFDLDVS